MNSLVYMAQNGDNEAFTRLMEQNKQSMYKVARAYLCKQQDVDDAIAETMFACWTNIKQLNEPEYFRTWLIRILINNCKRILKGHDRFVSLDSVPEASMPITYEAISADDFASIITLADKRYRLVLTLFYSEQYKIREISELTGLPEGTVSSHLRRGREQLSKRLRKEGI